MVFLFILVCSGWLRGEADFETLQGGHTVPSPTVWKVSLLITRMVLVILVMFFDHFDLRFIPEFDSENPGGSTGLVGPSLPNSSDDDK